VKTRRFLFVSTMQATPWGGSEELWCAAAEEALSAGHVVGVSTFDWAEPAPRVRALIARGAVLLTRPLKVPRVVSWIARWRGGSRSAWLKAHAEFGAEAICLSQGSPYELVGRHASRELLRWVMRDSPPIVNVVQFARDHEQLKAGTAKLARGLFERCTANRFVAGANIASVSRQIGAEVPRAGVIRNPVNLRDASALEWPAADDPARFACVARLVVAIKGQDSLLRALGAPAWRERAWRLSLVGSGPDEELLRGLARDLKIESRVDFLGQVEDLRAMWREHHVLVLPSLAEGTPLAMVEAMLLGRPCVVTPVGGTAEWVSETNGVLAKSAREHDVASAMEQAWSTRETWRSMGGQAREDARRLYDPAPGRTLLALMTEVAR